MTQSTSSEDSESSEEETHKESDSTKGWCNNEDSGEEICSSDSKVKSYLNVLLNNEQTNSEKWESSSPECPENVNVSFLLGQNQQINLVLHDDLIVNDLLDILRDIYGVTDGSLSLGLDGQILEPYRKLKSISEKSELELKVVFLDAYESQDEEADYDSYRKLTSVKNASAQTKERQPMCSRVTQTPYFPLVERSTNTPHDKFVQVDHTINPDDKVLEPKKYIMYEEYIKNQNEKAVMIQKGVRRFLAQKRILQMKKERDLQILKKKLQSDEISYEKLQEELRSILEKRSILCLDDFSRAYSSLAEWIKREKNKIKDKRESEKKQALKELFKKEMQALQYIHKLRMVQRDNNDYKNKIKLVEKTTKPTIRKYSKGNKTIVEDENTKIANVFNKILNNLKRMDCMKEERLQFLQELKDFLSSMNAPECTNEMISLAERECQMLLLGVNTNFLEGSRRRLLELFMHFSIDPEFNPGANKIRNNSKQRTPLLQCRICKELKPPGEFNVDILQGLRDCSKCTVRRELSQSNSSLVPYKELQKEIVFNEHKQGVNDGYINLMQPPDLYYLVHRIWEGRSCLSEVNDMKLLKLVRWNQGEIWSPWNCILLTEKEVDLHLSIANKEIFYGEHFIKKIVNKHLQAKMKFKKLEELYQKFKLGGMNSEESDSEPSVTECPLLSDIINLKTKKLNPKFVISESISDLIFP